MSLKDSIHASPHHSGTRFCDVPLSEYSARSRKSLRICQTCKGHMITQLLTVMPALYPCSIERFLQSFSQQTLVNSTPIDDALWAACGLENIPGLKRLRTPFLKCARHVAQEMALDLEGQDLVKVVECINGDPEKAYQWWKQRNVDRANKRDSQLFTALKPSPPLEATSESSSKLPLQPLEVSGLVALEESLLGLIKRREELHNARNLCIHLEERRRRAEVDWALYRGSDLHSALLSAIEAHENSLREVAKMTTGLSVAMQEISITVEG